MCNHVKTPPVMLLVAALLIGAPALPAEGIEPLADRYTVVYESPDAHGVYCYSPGIARLEGGRLIATMDIGGPRGQIVPGTRQVGKNFRKGMIFTSDDGGRSWTHRHDFHFVHARPFVAGRSLYVLGQGGDLKILRSDDGGVTWSATSDLTQGQRWHQAPSNVHYANGQVYLVMERRVYSDLKAWEPNIMAPVLMRAKVTDDLTQRSSWTFASELAYRDAVDEKHLDHFGVPFYQADPLLGSRLPGGKRVAPTGWCEGNVVQIVDPSHYWFDPSGRTFHLLMRAHTGGTNYAALAKVVENDDGSMTTMLETVPSGRNQLFVPMPGGQLKFHILYDAQTKLYWLLSSQPTDSMTRVELLPEDRFSLPNNERHRLQLHFSRNCVDWVFAGLVSKGNSPGEARHYASMVIDGDDLLVLSRSGDSRAKSAHDGNLITLHRVRDFRELVY